MVEMLAGGVAKGALMTRPGRWWKRERTRPWATGQVISVGGGAIIAGLFGVAGMAGRGTAFRLLGAAVVLAGLTLIVLAVRRSRR